MQALASRISAPTRGRPLQVADRFFAHSFRTREFGGLMNPLLIVDHFRMRADTFGRHRHEGISALTYVFPDWATAHYNIDSLGNELPIEPGGLHWFAAGRGAEHHEFPQDPGSMVHALQIFVDLPPALKNAEPFALHLSSHGVPVVATAGARIGVVAGEWDGRRSPLRTPQPFWLFDGHLDAGAVADIPVPIGWGAWAHAMTGNSGPAACRWRRAMPWPGATTPLRYRSRVRTAGTSC